MFGTYIKIKSYVLKVKTEIDRHFLKKKNITSVPHTPVISVIIILSNVQNGRIIE